ncbi:MIR motif-containing protein [Mycena crocata]|nr:MIR motif-containing protein [Mycena crocata]
MSRSILSSLCLVLIPGLLLLGLYNIQSARFQLHHMDLQAEPVSVEASRPAINAGSTVTVRHPEGYLHSHGLFYATGSLQQQVTLAPVRSEATSWRIFDANADYSTREHDSLQIPRQPIVPGMLVRLQHVGTGKHLHSHHEHRPPVTAIGDGLSEVTAYGMPGFSGDENDDWVVEPVEGHVLTTMSPFRLRHKQTGSHLSTRGATLPEWGLGLKEVLCAYEESAADLWIVEEAV